MAKQQIEEIMYTECFVAFIDILGFKSLVKASQSDPTLVATLVTALNRIALDTPQSTFTKAQHNDAGSLPRYKTWVLQVRPFSDCICLFLPTEAGRLTWLLRSVRYIHDRMLELGVCIRGAITIGGMYWDDTWGGTTSALTNKLIDQQFKTVGQSPPQSPLEREPSDVLYQAGTAGFPITLGPGLVEAYELENSAAVYPRVIASASLAHYLFQNGTESAFPLTSPSPEDLGIPLREFFQTSEDGLQFLHFLHERIDRQDTERIKRQTNADGTTTWRWEHRTTSWSEVLALANDLADTQLNGKLPDAVLAKYGWLKNYATRSAQSQPTAGGH